MSSTNEIAILAPHRHPRLRYVLRQLSDWWGVKLRLFTERDSYLAQTSEVGRIAYGVASSDLEEVHLFADAFMQGEDSVVANKVAMPMENTGRTLPSGLFPNPTASDFDPFAAIFFCLSRFEEYQPFKADSHGRFSAAASHAHRHQYLTRPVVNQVVNDLARRLNSHFPDLELKLPPPSLQLTYDVDVPYAYRYRGWRGIASGLRDALTGHPGRSIKRLRAANGNTKVGDPYDTFDWLEKIHQRHGIRATYFWLLANKRTSLDPNPDPDTPAIQQLIRHLDGKADTGIHPSYRSSDDTGLFTSEKEKLAGIVGHSVEKSRQHFLRFRLPVTYREILRAGLRQDYSMGYADASGYRAGTNLPFYWYDLEREEASWLKVHPFVAMDVTLAKYQKHGYFASQKILLKMAEDIQEAGGPFTLLWHNSSFAPEFGWKGWAEMYEGLVGELNALFKT
ncbi:hypothetical protein CEQ90_12960 [Lewinellaceae bacterium SD302]|nr:hypothetical protein CEQ90_12960 [Lewinellaceae bacterium SD302]